MLKPFLDKNGSETDTKIRNVNQPECPVRDGKGGEASREAAGATAQPCTARSRRDTAS